MCNHRHRAGGRVDREQGGRERVVLVHHHWDAEPQLGSGRIAKSHKHTLHKQILIGHLLDVGYGLSDRGACMSKKEPPPGAETEERVSQ